MLRARRQPGHRVARALPDHLDPQVLGERVPSRAHRVTATATATATATSVAASHYVTST